MPTVRKTLEKMERLWVLEADLLAYKMKKLMKIFCFKESHFKKSVFSYHFVTITKLFM